VIKLYWAAYNRASAPVENRKIVVIMC